MSGIGDDDDLDVDDPFCVQQFLMSLSSNNDSNKATEDCNDVNSDSKGEDAGELDVHDPVSVQQFVMSLSSNDICDGNTAADDCNDDSIFEVIDADEETVSDVSEDDWSSTGESDYTDDTEGSYLSESSSLESRSTFNVDGDVCTNCTSLAETTGITTNDEASIADGNIAGDQVQILRGATKKNCGLDKEKMFTLTCELDEVDKLMMNLAEESQALCQILIEMADDLDKHNFKVNVSTIAGSAATIAGTGLSIAGGVLSFFTFGASLALVVAGSALAASGGVTVFTSFVVDQVISRKRLKRAEELYTFFVESLKPFALHRPSVGPDDVLKPARDTVNIGNTVFAAVRLGQSGSCASSTAAEAAVGISVATAARTAFNSLGMLGKVVHIGGLAVNTVLLPLSIYDLVKSSIAVHKKTGSSAGCEIRKLVETIKEMIGSEYFINPHYSVESKTCCATADSSVEKMSALNVNAELPIKKNADEADG